MSIKSALQLDVTLFCVFFSQILVQIKTSNSLCHEVQQLYEQAFLVSKTASASFSFGHIVWMDDSGDAKKILTTSTLEETSWLSSDYLDEDSHNRWPQVEQADTDWNSQRGLEPDTLEAAGYKWCYAVLWSSSSSRSRRGP